MILVDANIPNLAEILSQKFPVKTFVPKELDNKFILENKCKYLFVRSTVLVNQDLLKGTEVEFVATATSGIDHFDIDYLESKNIIYKDAKGSNANSVSMYVLLAIADYLRKKNIQAQDCKVGIIGFGNIGSNLSAYLHKLNHQVFVNDPILKDQNYFFPAHVTHLGLFDLLETCDIVAIHVPLENEGEHQTKNLINFNNIHLLEEKLLINASRGGVIEEDFISEFGDSMQITIASDVFENEPSPNMNFVRTCRISTPHIAGHSINAKYNGTRMMVEQFEEYLQTKFDTRVLDLYPNMDHLCSSTPNLNYDLVLNSEYTRRIRDDHRFLRSLMDKSSQEIAKEFNSYRYNYAIREEKF
jgi:erythronate-4-phosphate dehydrogenase